jgi:hypothetical protein
MSQGAPAFKILFLLDPDLPRAKQKQLLTWVTNLRAQAAVETITDTPSESQIIEKVQKATPDLILLPWKLYLQWRKLELALGSARTQGPTTCAYSNEVLSFSDYPDTADRSRVLWLDLLSLSATESQLMTRCLLDPKKRSGLKPLLRPSTPILADTWTGSDQLGPRLDSILSLPAIKEGEWARRTPAIRVCLEALWSLVFELGPLKGDLAKALAAKIPKAYFQIAVDPNCIAFRLCYTRANSVPIGVVNAFRPRLSGDLNVASVLNQFSDFIRVHAIAETQDLEITVLLLPGAPSERFAGGLRSLWIEPLAPGLVSEPIYEEPGPQSPQLKKLFPNGVPISGTPKAGEPMDRDKVKELLTRMKSELQVRDDLIRDLKAGGVGTLQPSSPLRVEELIEALGLRIQEQIEQLRGLENRYATLNRTAPFSAEIEAIKRQLAQERERTQAVMGQLSQLFAKLAPRPPDQKKAG